MDIQDILTLKGVVPRLVATSKKHAIEQVARAAAEVSGLDSRFVFEVLLERERLGSTGVGHGIAIPHGKFAGLDRIHAVFARLDQPVDFDATDGAPVDLMFVLLAPESAGADHLKALSRVSRLLRDRTVCDRLRGATTREEIHGVLTHGHAQAA
ncbi:MAG: PTS IIA-like nitrogen regulatory protein PtsN [Alphaproteobacteria bacterium]